MGNEIPNSERLRMEGLMKRINEATANAFGWLCQLAYHGTHNFRHGAAQDAYAEGGVRLVMLRTGHLSEQCALHYARSDLERLKDRSYFSLNNKDRAAKAQAFIKEARERSEAVIASRDVRKLGNDLQTAPHPDHVFLHEWRNSFKPFAQDVDPRRLDVMKQLRQIRDIIEGRIPKTAAPQIIQQTSTTNRKREAVPQTFFYIPSLLVDLSLNDSKGKAYNRKVPKKAVDQQILFPGMQILDFERKLKAFMEQDPEASLSRGETA